MGDKNAEPGRFEVRPALYDRPFGDEGVDDETTATEVGCWAHARRRVFDAQLSCLRRRFVVAFVERPAHADLVI